jgi:type IV pilus biogenesis protein PilP
LLKAQLEIAKLKQGITDAGRPSGTSGPSPTGGIPSAFPMGASISPAAGPARLPQVLSISGSGANLSALLSMPNGGETLVRPGTKIAGGFTVRGITANGVEVSSRLAADRHGLEELPFAAGAASSGQGIGTTQGAMGIPSPSFASPVSMPPMGGMPGATPGMGGNALLQGANPLQDGAPALGGGE